MFNVLGRTDLYLRTEIIKKLFFVLIVAVTLKLGVTAMCIGIVAYNFIEMFVTILLLKKIMPITFREIFLNILPSLLLSVGMAVVTYFSIILFDSMLVKLLGGAIIAFVAYIGLSLIFKSHDLINIKKIIKTN